MWSALSPTSLGSVDKVEVASQDKTSAVEIPPKILAYGILRTTERSGAAMMAGLEKPNAEAIDEPIEDTVEITPAAVPITGNFRRAPDMPDIESSVELITPFLVFSSDSSAGPWKRAGTKLTSGMVDIVFDGTTSPVFMGTWLSNLKPSKWA